MKKTNSAVLVGLILIAVGANLNVVDPVLGLGVDIINDHLPFVGNLDEGLLTVIATLAGNELRNRQQAKNQA
jgi:hypothetical protein